MFSSSALGKGCPQLASASLPLCICLWGRGSILLPPQKLPVIVIIRQELYSFCFRDSPLGSDNMNPMIKVKTGNKNLPTFAFQFFSKCCFGVVKYVLGIFWQIVPYFKYNSPD